MTHLCFHESIKLNKPSENDKQPQSVVVSAKSVFPTGQHRWAVTSPADPNVYINWYFADFMVL